MELIGNPVKMSRTPVEYRVPPPHVGEHTEDVLKEFGLSDDEIARLRGDEII